MARSSHWGTQVWRERNTKIRLIEGHRTAWHRHSIGNSGVPDATQPLSQIICELLDPDRCTPPYCLHILFTLLQSLKSIQHLGSPASSSPGVHIAISLEYLLEGCAIAVQHAVVQLDHRSKPKELQGLMATLSQHCPVGGGTRITRITRNKPQSKRSTARLHVKDLESTNISVHLRVHLEKPHLTQV